MLRSMSAAISGLRNHQVYMDVVANNIANVNTTGFKASRVNFKEMVSGTMAVGSAPRAGEAQGGNNPTQVGLGLSLGGVDSIMTQGSLMNTGNKTDLAIQGEGFFVLQSNGSTYYTRDGSFGLDRDGFLVDRVSGAYVMGGENAATKVKVDPVWMWASFGIGADGKLAGVRNDGSLDTENQPQLMITKFSNPEGLVRAGGNLYLPGPNSGTPAPGDGRIGIPGTGGRGVLISGVLEGSNVDLAEQFSRMIMAQRGFQANSRIITASDEMLQELVNMKR